MKFLDLQENIQPPDEEIVGIIQDYLKKSSQETNHRIREQYLMEMLALLIKKVNEFAKEGDNLEVADNLCSAAYYLEEFDYDEARQIYKSAIMYYEKYMLKLQKEGKFDEASWTANQIAELFRSKLNDIESEKKYILKCIEYKTALVEILEGFVKPRKLSILFYNLGNLYSKLEDWSNAIKSNELSLKIAMENKYYDVVADVYFNLSDIYLFSGYEEKSKDVFDEAKNYFLEEEEICIQKKDYYLLSQIYQILKNINSAMNNTVDFKKFSRKEAYTYIKLARKILKNGKDPHKIASFYRGAALCYRETDSDFLEGASCFLIAGNIFRQLGEQDECELCYNDSAELFEEIGIYDKAIQLYNDAADFALSHDDYESAIEKLMNAFDLAETKNLKNIKMEIAEKIITRLEELSKREIKKGKYFIAATLLVETLPYLIKIGYVKDSQEITEILHKISKYYNMEYESNSGNGKSSTIAYVIALNAISKITLNKFDEAEKCINKLDESESELTKYYKKIVQSMLEAKKNAQKFDLSYFSKKIKKIFSNSEEIKLLSNFLFY